MWREIRTRLARIRAGGGDSRVRRSAVAPIVLIIVFAVVCVIVAVQWSAYRADEVALHQERQLFAQAIAQRRAEILRDVESIVVSDNAVNRLWNDFDWTWVHNRVGLRLKNYFEQSHVFVVDSFDRFAYAMAGRSSVGPKWFGAMTAELIEDVARQVDEEAQLIIRIDQPWGEYQSRGQHRLSPLQIVDALVRSGVGLSAVNLEVAMGYFRPGGSARRDRCG